jgi:GMP synthase (glutamine-hydrolysing)
MDPWVLNLLEVLRHYMKQRTPLLGFCFGHQILARAASSEEMMPVRAAAKQEYGWIEVEWLRVPRLMPELKGTSVSFAAHQDEVMKVPEGWQVFAASKDCGIQGMEHPVHPWFSVQFHPEKDMDQAMSESAIYRSDGRLYEDSDRLAERASKTLGLELLSGFLREAGL